MNENPPNRSFARRLTLGLLALVLVTGGFLLPACAAEDGKAGGAGQVLARVNGEEITEADVRELAKAEFDQAEAQLVQCQANYEQTSYDILERGIKTAIEENLMTTEADKRGMSVEDLKKAEIDGKVTEVTDEEVDAWYEENKARIRGEKAQLTPRIRQFLGQERATNARAAFVTVLRKGADVAILLDPPRVEVASAGHPAKGPEGAPITIVEFSDFECPFCSQVNPTLDQVREKYGDKVRMVFRQFPLAMHANAQKAAEASLCAEEQGKFWEMHDSMFANQRQLAVASLKTQAGELGLDAEAFNTCLDSGKHAAQVRADMADGTKAGVRGTPAMFINGRFINGAVPFKDVADVIDDELMRMGTE